MLIEFHLRTNSRHPDEIHPRCLHLLRLTGQLRGAFDVPTNPAAERALCARDPHVP